MKLKILKSFLLVSLILLVLFIAGGAYYALQGEELQPWHTFAPKELSADELNKASWTEYLTREQQIFDSIRTEVTAKIPANQRTIINRYYDQSTIYTPNFEHDWNRSYTLTVEKPVGAVVFLHGLTDSPYSSRKMAKMYQEQGFVVVAIRIPGHGTVPAGLAKAHWSQWLAAAKLAVREAKRLTSPEAPLHIVGFSNGGALSMKYALDSLEDQTLARPDRVILISPMIGITRMARLADVFALTASIPGLEKLNWLSITPEFNPFKYNSFPVNAVVQARELINSLQQQTERLYKSEQIKKLPPVLTFQSIVDYTVSTPAIITNLYAYLPANGSELVLFDVNHATIFRPLMRPASGNMLERILPDLPQRYRITVVTNASPTDLRVIEKTFPAGKTEHSQRALGASFPPNIYSLSHVALPFALNDSLYGLNPETGKGNEFGINLGTMMTAQGERGVLLINMGSLLRIASNPFFDYMTDRMATKINDAIETNEQTPPKYADTKPKMSSAEYDALTEVLPYKDTGL